MANSRSGRASAGAVLAGTLLVALIFSTSGGNDAHGATQVYELNVTVTSSEGGAGHGPVFGFGALPEVFIGTFQADDTLAGPISNLALTIGGIDIGTAFPSIFNSSFDPVTLVLVHDQFIDVSPTLSSSVSFRAAGTVDANDTVGGPVPLATIEWLGDYSVNLATTPFNDNCANAIAITDGLTAGTLVDATNDGTGSCDVAAGSPDVWYEYQAPSCETSVTLSMCGTAALPGGLDTVLTIYDTCSGNELECGNDTFGFCASNLDAAAFTTVLADQTILIRVSSADGSVGDFTLNLETFCIPTCPGPDSLSCTTDCATGDLSISWFNANPGFLSDFAVDVFAASGALVHNEFIFHDSFDQCLTIVSGLANGTYDIVVSSLCGDGTLNSDGCRVTLETYQGQPNVVFRGEGAAGLVDSAGALAAAFDTMGQGYLVIDSLQYPCLDQLASAPNPVLWLMLGTGSNGYALTPADGQKLVDLLNAGISIYVESADNWGFNPAHPFFDYDGVEGLTGDGSLMATGDDNFVAMTGLVHANLDLSDLIDVSYTQDSAGDDSTDRLIPTNGAQGSGLDSAGSLSGLIWSDSDEGYGTAVYYRTQASLGHVISQTWEFGGFGGDLQDLAQRYSAALRFVEPSFQRGDCNSDSGFDIADAIAVLSLLFGGGSSDCVDACDGNDDGLIDIADGIALLNGLFGPSAPLPEPVACATDPTADLLTCTGSPCP